MDSQTLDSESAKVPRANTLAFIIPFVAFMLIATQYPKFQPANTLSNAQNKVVQPGDPDDDLGEVDLTLADSAEGVAPIEVQPNPVAARKYLILIGVQVLVGLVLISIWMRTYLSHFPLRFSWLAVWIGAIGIVLWIGLCELGIESRLMTLVGFPPQTVARASFRPYFEIQSPQTLYVFLGLRFTLLALIVPIIEELFLRGWLVRWIEGADQWNTVSLTKLAFAAVATATVYGVMTHPGEAIAAACWFSLVTWLMLKSGNVWDCILAHAVTNLLLGVYVMWFQAWHLW